MSSILGRGMAGEGFSSSGTGNGVSEISPLKKLLIFDMIVQEFLHLFLHSFSNVVAHFLKKI